MTSALAVRESEALAEGDDRVAQITPERRFAVMARTIRLALADAKEPVEVKEVIDQAQVGQAYAKAFLSAEHVQYANEVYIWACRRAGELRLHLPEKGSRSDRKFDYEQARRLIEDEGMPAKEVADLLGVKVSAIYHARRRGWQPVELSPRRQFDDEFGVSRDTARSWMLLARTSDPELASEIAELKRSGKLSLRALLGAMSSGAWTRIEHGVEQHSDGRYRIKWKKDGKRHTHPIPAGSTLDDARRELAIARGQIKEPKPPTEDTALGHVYESVALAREQFGKVRGGLSREQRLALGPLYEELDDLAKRIVKATNL